MKILVAQDWLRSGGTERQSLVLAGAFRAAGARVALLTFRPGGKLEATVPPGVERITLQPFDTKLDWFAPGLLRAAQRFAPDVTLCMGRMANCHAGMLQRRRPDTPVVATMRTGKPLPWLFRRSLREVRRVVANSEDAARTLTRVYAVPAHKIAVIHNSLVFAPVTARPQETRAAVRARYGAGPDTHVWLCVAMFRPEKNQRELIAALAAMPAGSDRQLWLAGEGPAKAECERLAIQLGVADRVRFIGFTTDPAPLYLAADVAVHASGSEGLSNFIVEAQAHGLPAVVYAAQGMEECMRPGRTGWVVPVGERARFCAQIDALAREAPEPAAARRAEAQAFARAAFDPRRQAGAYLALFAELTAGR